MATVPKTSGRSIRLLRVRTCSGLAVETLRVITLWGTRFFFNSKGLVMRGWRTRNSTVCGLGTGSSR